MINEYERAAQEIDRRAVTQSHAVRKAMKDVAKWAAGVDLKSKTDSGFTDGVYFSIPVKVDGKQTHYAKIDITFGIDGELTINSELQEVPEEAQVAG